MSIEERQRYWLELVKHWQASNLSQAEFCRRENIIVERFYAWRQTLERRRLLKPIVEQSAKPKASLVKVHQFVPVQISKESSISTQNPACLEVTTPTGYVVRIP